MAVTWAASAPHATAVKEVANAGFSAKYGPAPSSVYVSWMQGNKRFVLTKLTATGTYSTGGDALPALNLLGLKEVHAAFLVSSPTTNVKPVVIAAAASGQPTVLTTTSTAPKVQYFNASAEATNGTTITNDAFHVLLVGI